MKELFKLILISALAGMGIMNIAKAQTSGTCGDNLTWQLTGSGNSLTLTISGDGEMYDYTIYSGGRPWDSYKSNIKTVIIENRVTAIGECAFYQCSNLEFVTIPKSVVKLGYRSFFSCGNLTTITIPDSVTTIESGVFEACSNLTSINVNANNPNYSSDDGVLYNKLQDTLICCPAGKSETFTIPDFVTMVADKAFQNCRKLTSITVPGSVFSIGVNAFAICTSLTAVNVAANNMNYSSNDGIFYNKLQDTLICCPSGKTGAVTIPNTVITIADEAFNFCRDLVSVIIPNSVTTIGKAVFAHCYGLSSVEIGNSIESIGDFAFWWCSGLTSIIVPNSVTSMGNYIFSDCFNLKSATIGDSVAEIGESAFSNCNRLSSIIIPNSVSKIGYTAFYECYSLVSVIIGNSVTEIGDGAFAYCIRLDSITCKAKDPPVIDFYTFYGVPINAQVFVPCHTLSDYQSSDWGNIFTNFIEECTTSLNEDILNEKITFYPNPVSDIFFVECKEFSTIKIHDISGKEVLTQNANGKTEINISHLPQGVYNVNVLFGTKIVGSKKFVKQKKAINQLISFFCFTNFLLPTIICETVEGN